MVDDRPERNRLLASRRLHRCRTGNAGRRQLRVASLGERNRYRDVCVRPVRGSQPADVRDQHRRHRLQRQPRGRRRQHRIPRQHRPLHLHHRRRRRGIHQALLTDNCSCTWSLRATNGSLEHGYPATALNDVGPTWLPAGNYVLTVTGTAADTGTYSFTLTTVPNPQTFTIATGDTISNGNPAAGAGNIESPGSTDRYTFTIAAGGARIHQALLTDNCSCTWSLRATNGSLEHGYPATALNDVGPTWLPAGNYVLTVTGTAADTGTYSFTLTTVPNPQTFTIATGDTVSNGNPAAGAGNIESPGSTDRYTFTIGAGGARIRPSAPHRQLQLHLVTASNQRLPRTRLPGNRPERRRPHLAPRRQLRPHRHRHRRRHRHLLLHPHHRAQPANVHDRHRRHHLQRQPRGRRRQHRIPRQHRPLHLHRRGRRARSASSGSAAGQVRRSSCQLRAAANSCGMRYVPPMTFSICRMRPGSTSCSSRATRRTSAPTPSSSSRAAP